MKRPVAAAVASMLVTAISVVVILNLTMGDDSIDRHIEHRYAAGSPQFVRVMNAMLGPGMLDGNRVEALVNGDGFFPVMLDTISGARHTICFETYIYWSGEIGKAFAERLSERARAGVRVHVVLDWLGSGKLDESLLDEMRSAGVEVERYNPPRWYALGRLNNRTHRKLLVVDGRIGFTGGAGIADEWRGNAQDPRHWRDTHFRIEGPAVAQMQAAFMENWTEVTGKVLHGEEYFPPLRHVGRQSAQVFTSSPGSGAETMQLMYMLSIASAAKSIRLSAAYFVPDEPTLDAFRAALRRGVRVEIIMPGPRTDVPAVRRASRSKWGVLLEEGALIYEYQPTMFHCKVMIVDGLWTSVGSTNFDSRSFSVNDEANLNVYDASFAASQSAIFDEDIRRSRRITLEEWVSRPWSERLRERAMGALDTQL